LHVDVVMVLDFVACSVGIFQSSFFVSSCVWWVYRKPVFGDDIVVIYVFILFTEFRYVSLYGIHMFSSVGRHDTRMQVQKKFNIQLEVAVTRNINANNIIHIKQQQYKTKKIKATRKNIIIIIIIIIQNKQKFAYFRNKTWRELIHVEIIFIKIITFYVNNIIKYNFSAQVKT